MTGVLYLCNLLTGLVNILDLNGLNRINFCRGYPVVLIIRIYIFIYLLLFLSYINRDTRKRQMSFKKYH